MKRLPERSYIETRKEGKTEKETLLFQEERREEISFKYDWVDRVIENENERRKDRKRKIVSNSN